MALAAVQQTSRTQLVITSPHPRLADADFQRAQRRLDAKARVRRTR